MARPKKSNRDGITLRADGYYASFTDHKGQRKQMKLKGCISLTEAKRLRDIERAKVTEAIATGKPTASTKSFEELTGDYLKYQATRLTPASYIRTEGITRLHLVPAFGKMQLSRIRAGDVLDYITDRSAEITGDTMLKELGVLTHIFSWAVKKELVAINPCTGVERPKHDPGRLRYLQPAELNLILQKCPEWLRPIVGLLVFTGMRRSELLTLRWIDVDRQAGRFLLPKTKNNTSRIIWLNNRALTILDSLPKNSARPLDRVFPASEQITPENVSIAFLRAARAAGVDSVRLHDCRHTFASWLRMSGCELDTVGELLGHKDPRMTKRYSQLSPVYLQDATKRLDVVFGPELVDVPMLNGEIASHDSNPIDNQNCTKPDQTYAS
jgi:integrase